MPEPVEVKEEGKYLTLMDSFKLHVWTFWKAGLFQDLDVIQILDFVDTLSEKETADYCFAELEALRKKDSKESDASSESIN